MAEHPDKIPDLQKAREFIERMRFNQAQLSASELDLLLGDIIADDEASLPPVIEKTRKSRYAVNQWLKIAAILLLSLLSAVVINDFAPEEEQVESLPTAVEWRTVENPKGRKSKVTLPDGTRVNLNYASKLTFPKAFEGQVREVELVGEAFFDVVPNDTMPFLVRTGELTTEVLGTSFNIRFFDGETETDISLVSGKVKVNHVKDKRSPTATELSPGEQFSYDRNSGKAVTTNFDVEKITAWKEGTIIFEDTGFKEFIDQLENWYGVNFQLYGNPPQNWKVNGRYQNQKLDDILTGLNFVYGLEYKIQGKNVILKIE